TPEIAGLPYVVSGLVAAGGLAAALSTADGLLLTIANALAHDFYYKLIDPTATTGRRVFLSKFLLVCAAITAAYVTSLKPGDILFLVGAAFSLGASSFFPCLVMGIFWKRASKWGAIIGMGAGLGICVYYMVTRYPFFGINMPLWFGLSPVSAGMFGLPTSMITIYIVSLLTPAPSNDVHGPGRRYGDRHLHRLRGGQERGGGHRQGRQTRIRRHQAADAALDLQEEDLRSGQPEPGRRRDHPDLPEGCQREVQSRSGDL